MKLKIETILLMMTLCLVSGCERMFMGERIDTNPVVTFDYLWQQVDERYSLFDVKEVDWGAMYDSLRPRVYNDMSDEELFSVCRDLLNSLNDGHVDLWSSTDVASSEAIFLQRYAQNNIDINTVALTYLGPHRHTTGGLTYNSIDSGRHRLRHTPEWRRRDTERMEPDVPIARQEAAAVHNTAKKRQGPQ